MIEKITPKACPEEFKGTKTYRLAEAHYRGVKMYKAGDTITVTDEVPGRSWVLLEEGEAKAAAKPAPKADAKAPTRASDRSI